MNLDEIPLFSMLKSRLSYLGQRQQIIATNIANVLALRGGGSVGSLCV